MSRPVFLICGPQRNFADSIEARCSLCAAVVYRHEDSGPADAIIVCLPCVFLQADAEGLDTLEIRVTPETIERTQAFFAKGNA